MGVSINGGTPNHPFLVEFSIINHPVWVTPILGNPHIKSQKNTSTHAKNDTNLTSSGGFHGGTRSHHQVIIHFWSDFLEQKPIVPPSSGVAPEISCVLVALVASAFSETRGPRRCPKPRPPFAPGTFPKNIEIQWRNGGLAPMKNGELIWFNVI